MFLIDYESLYHYPSVDSVSIDHKLREISKALFDDPISLPCDTTNELRSTSLDCFVLLAVNSELESS